MSTMQEIGHAVSQVRHAGLPLGILQCTSAYPCPADQVGLNMLDVYRQRFRCAVGLSDHSGTIFPGLAAVTLGASILEVHVTFSRRMFGPDVPASLTVDELDQLVHGARDISRMLASPVDKDAMAQSLEPLRQIFTKSVVAREYLPAGTVLENHHLTAKKPGTGIPAERLSDLIGRRLCRSVQQNQFLVETDVE
jgi:N-acetylneuraminate synthase